MASEGYVIIGSCNGWLPIRRQAITWTYDGLLPTGPSETNASEIKIKILQVQFIDALHQN